MKRKSFPSPLGDFHKSKLDLQLRGGMGPASIHLGDFGGGGPIGLHAGAGGMMGIGLGGQFGGGLTTNEDCGIREVWAHNLDEEFKTICYIVRNYPYVAMDTEFPGVVARPIGEFKSSADYQYQLLRCNVDLLKIIQLGVTFLDEKGNLPEGITTWQFNFKFNLTEDMYAEDSVDLLQTSGIQFEKHEQEGIDPMLFAEMMLMSGLVLMPQVKWLSFHSGYDFGYLINLLTNQNLPKTEADFFEQLKTYFPNVYDVKYLMKSCKNLKGGLQDVANELEVTRVGPQHQAGSDSLLTGQTFFRMKEMFFEDDIDDSKYLGHLFGLGTSHVVAPANSSSTPVSTADSRAAAAAVAAATIDLNDDASSTKSSGAADSEVGGKSGGDNCDKETMGEVGGSSQENGEVSGGGVGMEAHSSQDSNIIGGVNSILGGGGSSAGDEPPSA